MVLWSEPRGVRVVFCSMYSRYCRRILGLFASLPWMREWDVWVPASEWVRGGTTVYGKLASRTNHRGDGFGCSVSFGQQLPSRSGQVFMFRRTRSNQNHPALEVRSHIRLDGDGVFDVFERGDLCDGSGGDFLNHI